MDFINRSANISITIYTGPDELTFQIIDQSLKRSYRKLYTLESEELGIFRYIGGLTKANRILVKEFEKWEKGYANGEQATVNIGYKENQAHLSVILNILDSPYQLVLKLIQERVNQSHLFTKSELIKIEKHIDKLDSVITENCLHDKIFLNLVSRISLIGTELVPRNLENIHIIHDSALSKVGSSSHTNGNSLANNIHMIGNTLIYGGTTLKQLGFMSNQYTAITNEKLLIVENDDINQLVQDLATLPNLSQIFICGFNTDKLEFPISEKLTKLVLVDCKLKCAPDFNKFSKLETLCLDSTRFGGGQPNLKNLTHLNFLSIGNSDISNPHISGLQIL